ncbi:MAG TPA: DUF4192 domain-containing protein, partial [Pseudonocardiaceae bacterium]
MNAMTGMATRLTHPAELVTGLPYLLGFHPTDSLVVITLQPGDPPTVGLVLRADLPPPEDERELVEQLCTPVRTRGVVAALVVVLGPRETASAALVTRLRSAFGELGVAVPRALWAESTRHGARWSCLDDPRLGGALPDPAEHRLAAVSTVAGLVTFTDRSALAALLAPDAEEALARRAALLDAHVDEADRDRADGRRAAER